MLAVMSESNLAVSAIFEAWVDYCFNAHRLEEGPVVDYFRMLPSITLAHYFHKLFSDPMPHLQHRSFEDIGAGVPCLFGAGHGYWWEIRDSSVPEEEQANAVLALTSLYKKCFDFLCDDRGEAPARGFEELNPLDGAVYMIWDYDCLEGAVYCKEEHLVGPIFSVLEEALNCKTVACQISGLHGLGHLHFSEPERVTSIIEPFIRCNKAALPWVNSYSKEALFGDVR